MRPGIPPVTGVLGLAMILIAWSWAAKADFMLSRTFDDPTPQQLDLSQQRFGSSIASDGSRVLIGAWGDDTQGFYVGQAHLFDAKTGALLHTFDDPTPTYQDRFGLSVALQGNRVLIGAPGDGTQWMSVGQAHLFDATTGELLHTFDDPTPTNPSHDFDYGGWFGQAVAIDGNQVLIGEPYDHTQGWPYVGQAHLFDATTGSLLRTFEAPPPAGGDGFGMFVALEGNRVLISAQSDDTQGLLVGQAYLFDASTGTLLHTFDDPTPTDRDFFGNHVAVHGNQVLIGAPGDDTHGEDVGQAHLFDATSGALLHTLNDPTPAYRDYFGTSVALDGNQVLIGARGYGTQGEYVGQAHLFDAATGALLHTFDDPTPTERDQFGRSVFLDSKHVLIGAPFDDTHGIDVGQAHLFTGALAPVPDIKINKSDGPLTLTGEDTIQLSLRLDNRGRTEPADWWLVADSRYGRLFWTPRAGWTYSQRPAYRGPLYYLREINSPSIPVGEMAPGRYRLYFGVDLVMDGAITWRYLYADSIEVHIVP